MIEVTNWIAHIPEEEQRIAYVGENETETRLFRLTDADRSRYTYYLDIAFDLSTVTSVTRRQKETTSENRQETIGTDSSQLISTKTKESGLVSEATVGCDIKTDVVPLPASVDSDGVTLTWTILAQHTQLPGSLQATLRGITADGRVRKSAIMTFQVEPAVTAVAAKPPVLSEKDQIIAQMESAYAAYAAKAAASEALLEGYVSSVDASAAAAEQSATNASNAASAAGMSRTAAEGAAATAAEKATAAVTSAAAAQTAQTAAEDAADTATDKAAAAAASAAAAEESAANAALSERNAAASASDAGYAADTATDKASAAYTHADAAAASAATALRAQNQAYAHASGASAARIAAENSANAAAASAAAAAAAAKGMRLIKAVTMAADAASLEISTDTSGAAFALRQFAVYAVFKGTYAADHLYTVYCNAATDIQHLINYSTIPASFPVGTPDMLLSGTYCGKAGSTHLWDTCGASTGGYTIVRWYPMTAVESITKFIITSGLKAGDEIYIYGIDAGFTSHA